MSRALALTHECQTNLLNKFLSQIDSYKLLGSLRVKHRYCVNFKENYFS